MEKGRVPAILFILSLATNAFCLEWYEAYDRGKKAVEKGKCAEGEPLLLEALRKNSKPELKARPYGVIQMEYIPHVYLIRCAIQNEDFTGAVKWLKEAEASGIYYSSSKSLEFAALKSTIKEKIKPPEAKPEPFQVEPNRSEPAATGPAKAQSENREQEEQKAINRTLGEAKVLLAAGSFEQAREAANKVLRNSPNHPDALRIVSEANKRKALELAELEKRKKMEEAKKLEQLNQQRQIESQKQESEIQKLIEKQVLIAYYRGQYDVAIQLVEQNLSNYSDSWRLHFYQGCSYATLSMLEEKEREARIRQAKDAFHKAKSISANIPIAQLNISPKIIEIYESS